MNLSKLEELMKSIADLKTQLHTEASDALSIQLHQLQDQLTDEFGAYIEEAIFSVHDEYCPDDEIHAISDYMPAYFVREGVNGHSRFLLPLGQGVEVETDDYPGIPTRLALVPNPTRLVLKIQDNEMEEVLWVARELAEA